MKSKVFLIIISSLLFNLNTYSSFNRDKVEALWGSANLQVDKNNIHLFSKDEKNPSFLSVDISSHDFKIDHDNIVLDLMVDDLRAVNGIEIRFSESKVSENYLYYVIPLFTDYEFNLLQSSNPTRLSISGANLKEKGKGAKSLNYMTIYFSAKTTNTRLTLWPLKKTKKIDRGILTITFDDGAKDNLLADRELSNYKFPITTYIMPDSLNTKDFLKESELKMLSKKYWQVESHHEIPFTFFSSKQLSEEIERLEKYFKRNEYKKDDFHLAYPLGKINKNVEDIVRKSFATARLASGGIETIPPGDYHKLRAFNVLNTTTPEELKEIIDKTKKSKQWLILMFHHIKDQPKDEIDYSTENFKELLKIIKESNIDIMSIDEVWKKYLK
ncbi:polysaccharide deacetylase family protein [Halobacteriovorax marinus]|nr:polysaccharide deacetylase family protein [Halobacteriovorax marinus]